MRLIDADALIEQLLAEDYKEHEFCYPCNKIIQTIENAATVDGRQKGKWKHEHLCSTSGGTYEVVRCSECAWQYPMTATNYCPHCGAEMEREE